MSYIFTNEIEVLSLGSVSTSLLELFLEYKSLQSNEKY